MTPEEINKKAYEKYPVKMGLWFDSHGIPEEIDLNEEARNAYAAGMSAEHERLMKEAVEVTVYYDFENRLAVTVQLPEDSPHKFCDKVKLIILK